MNYRRYSTEFKIEVVQEYLDDAGSSWPVAVRQASATRWWGSGPRNQRGEI